MRSSSLLAGLKAAAGKSVSDAERAGEMVPAPTPHKGPQEVKTVLIGGHFSPEVRRTLLLIQAERANTGKNLKQLLGEAINDLAVKYGKPQPYSGEL